MQWAEFISQDIGPFAAAVIIGLAGANIAQWLSNRKDAKEYRDKMMEIANARAADHKLFAEQLVENTNTINSTLDALTRLEVNRV